MYAEDHNPPHFHAKYAGQDVAVETGSLAVVAGRLPTRPMRLVQAWAAMHQAELAENWDRMVAGQRPVEIGPLP